MEKIVEALTKLLPEDAVAEVTQRRSRKKYRTQNSRR